MTPQAMSLLPALKFDQKPGGPQCRGEPHSGRTYYNFFTIRSQFIKTSNLKDTKAFDFGVKLGLFKSKFTQKKWEKLLKY